MGKGRKKGLQSDAGKGQLLSLFYKERKRKARKDPKEWNKRKSVTPIEEKY